MSKLLIQSFVRSAPCGQISSNDNFKITEQPSVTMTVVFNPFKETRYRTNCYSQEISIQQL